MSVYRYEIILYWSAEDAAFIAEVPELPGCMAHGESQDEALRHVQDAMAAWIEVAQEIGRSIPEPRGRLMYA
ncbi:MAG: type II toxin-antitoxin system HicB family antitoxin [Methyloceanibacter sp.]